MEAKIEKMQKMFNKDDNKEKSIKANTAKRISKKDSKKRRKELQKNQKTMNEMKVVSPYLSIIILNINGLNPPIKRS